MADACSDKVGINVSLSLRRVPSSPIHSIPFQSTATPLTSSDMANHSEAKMPRDCWISFPPLMPDTPETPVFADSHTDILFPNPYIDILSFRAIIITFLPPPKKCSVSAEPSSLPQTVIHAAIL